MAESSNNPPDPTPVDRRRLNLLASVAFVLGGSLFALGAAFAQVGSQSLVTVNVTYLVGGFFFSLGGYASIMLTSPGELGRRSAVVLFVGTLLFAVSLVAAFAEGLTPRQSNGWIWFPDILGCVCFLASGHLAMLDVGEGHVRVRPRLTGWWVVAVNQIRIRPVFPRRARGLHASRDDTGARRRPRELGDVRRRCLLRGGRRHTGIRQTHIDKRSASRRRWSRRLTRSLIGAISRGRCLPVRPRG